MHHVQPASNTKEGIQAIFPAKVVALISRQLQIGMVSRCTLMRTWSYLRHLKVKLIHYSSIGWIRIGGPQF